MPPSRRRQQVSYELLKVLVSGAGVVALGLALQASFTLTGCADPELQIALTAGIVGLAGFSGRESARALVQLVLRKRS